MMAKRTRGRSIYPAPVACATFAGGESIRMSFYQLAGKPWRFDAARAMLAQAIGNERARSQGSYFASIERRAKVEALRARPGTEGERTAAEAALKRISAKSAMERLAARIDALPRTNAHPPATDFLDFWLEHDGRRVEVEQRAVPRPRKARLRAVEPAVEVEAIPAPLPVAAVADTRAADLVRQLVEADACGGSLSLRRWRAIDTVIREARQYLDAA